MIFTDTEVYFEATSQGTTFEYLDINVPLSEFILPLRGVPCVHY
jgi:hypothetical protein